MMSNSELSIRHYMDQGSLRTLSMAEKPETHRHTPILTVESKSDTSSTEESLNQSGPGCIDRTPHPYTIISLAILVFQPANGSC
jgi:hypothetical protein